MTGLFITGTDTGVGKTLVSVAILHALSALGYRVVGMKPVAAGAEQGAEGWVNGDLAQLKAASNVTAPAEWINPYLFREAIAPHIAAEHKGVTIELPRIRAAYEGLTSLADVVVVEGVGGFRVPLTASADTADLAVSMDLPVIMVVGMRLGCLNHALLTAEALAARGLELAGWVANGLPPPMAAHRENLATLTRLLPGLLLAELPCHATPDPLRMAALFAPKHLESLVTRRRA
jgi:dethiobiotin synthetase